MNEGRFPKPRRDPGNPGEASYDVVTICGSMRYFPRMLAVAAQLTEQGWIVLMPFTVAEEESLSKLMLDGMHRAKIDMSRGIVVVGKHIGKSTKAEIEYAIEHGKTVRHMG